MDPTKMISLGLLFCATSFLFRRFVDPASRENNVLRSLEARRSLSFLRSVLNDMSVHFGCGDEYEPEFVDELRSCLSKWDDPSLAEAVDAHWEGFAELFRNSSDDDPWVDCLRDPTHPRCTAGWEEASMERWSVFGNGTDREMVVMEPCNYASNVAYYHAVLRLCEYDGWGGDGDGDDGDGDDGDDDGDDESTKFSSRRALKRGFATLAAGSALMHGSHTSLGSTLDNLMIAVTVYVSYQDLATALGWTSDDEDEDEEEEEDDGDDDERQRRRRLLRCLDAEVDDCANAADLAETTSLFSLNHPVERWHDLLREAKDSFPSDLKRTYAAASYVLIRLAFSPGTADAVQSFLVNLLLNDDDKAFLAEEYAPAARPLLEQIRLDPFCRLNLQRKFWGMIVKIVYAFLFQEILIDAPSPIALWFGVSMSPFLNAVFSVLNGFGARSAFAKLGRNLYPGDGQCNTLSPHAFWHQQSAEGYVDLVLTYDYLTSIITDSKTQ